MISLDHRSDTTSSIRDPMGSKIYCRYFTMGSDWIMDPMLQLFETSSGIIDPTLGS